MKIAPILSAVVLAAAATAFVRGQGAVLAPAKRQTVLELANQLLASKEHAKVALPAELVDPFNPPSFGAAPAVENHLGGEATHAKASDSEILREIASRITPSGMVLFGGEPYLLFREKRLKVGDHLTITFEGTDYVVVITAIDETSFKVRLNREEITRPIIKPGKVP